MKKYIINKTESGEFLKTVDNIYRTDRDGHEVLFQTLSSLHNEGSINVINEFQKLKKSDTKHDFYLTRCVLEAVLPDLNAPVSEVMECVKQLTIEAGQDMAAGMLISPFIRFMKADSSRPEEALNIALNHIDGTFDFITPVILAGTKFNIAEYVNKAIELSQHPDPNIKNHTINALGHIEYSEELALIDKSIEAINSVLDQRYNENLFALALRASYSLYSQDKTLENAVVVIFQKILKYKDDNILHAASEILFFKYSKTPIPKRILKLLLGALKKTNPKNTRTINHIDYGITGLFNRGEEDEVILFIENIMLDNYEITINQFGNLSKVIIDNPKYLNKIITRWLLSKNVRLGKSASELLPINPEKEYILSAEIDQISESDQGIYAFLARKACGWLFVHQVSAVSFILSLIEEAPGEDVKAISEILFNPLLISYPSSVKKYLEKAIANASEKLTAVIQELIERLDKYHEGLKSATDIKELRPSQAHQETYHRYNNRLMNESKEKADKNSVLTAIFTPSIVLYGNKLIHYIHDSSDNQATRQEVPFQEFSCSIELPSLESLNHNGLNLMMMDFQLEGCSS